MPRSPIPISPSLLRLPQNSHPRFVAPAAPKLPAFLRCLLAQPPLPPHLLHQQQAIPSPPTHLLHGFTFLCCRPIFSTNPSPLASSAAILISRRCRPIFSANPSPSPSSAAKPPLPPRLLHQPISFTFLCCQAVAATPSSPPTADDFSFSTIPTHLLSRPDVPAFPKSNPSSPLAAEQQRASSDQPSTASQQR